VVREGIGSRDSASSALNNDEPRSQTSGSYRDRARNGMTRGRRSWRGNDQLDDVVWEMVAPRSPGAAAPVPSSGRCRGASEPEVDSSRVECLEGAELFGDTRASDWEASLRQSRSDDRVAEAM